MAANQQHRTHDIAGENHADEGVGRVLEHVSGRGAAGGDSRRGIDVLEEDFSVSFYAQGEG